MKQNYKAWLLHNVLFLLILFGFTFNAKATIYPFALTYSGANENPPNGSPATGTVIGTYDDLTNRIFYTVTFSGLSAPATGAHFHAPAPPNGNAPIIIPFNNFPAATSGTYSGSNVITDLQETQLFAGLWYANIHSSVFPGGEIRVQVILGAPSETIYTFSNTYSGLNEVPPNGSPATGTVIGTYNSLTNRLFYTVNFSGLSANATGAHFHGPALPGTNAPILVPFNGFPAATFGSYSGSAILSDLFETQLLSNLWYANIHTSVFPGGEIRTQVTPLLPASIICPHNIVVSNGAGLCTASVNFSATASGIPTPSVVYKIGSTVISSPYAFPVGTTTVTATASNSVGTESCSFAVTVNDTEGPGIHNLSASPDNLWPPNHKMKDVTVNYTTSDNCPGPVGCSVYITSNEPVNGTGDGDTGPDWAVIDNHHIQLRAERAGNGNGRIYTITTTCHDQYDNMRQSSTTVTVQQSQGNSAFFVGDTEPLTEDVLTKPGIQINVLNNPSKDKFTLNIQTSNRDKISVRLYDIYGRVVESQLNLAGSQALTLGAGVKAGFYVVEAIQGQQKTQVKLVKLL